jgi:UDP-glucose 4-epimerase
VRILVTGGAGYIGSITAKVLVEAGHDVAVFDNLSVGHRQAVLAPARLFVGGLADTAGLDAVFERERPECVMHFAALSQVGESVLKPDRYFHNNVACGVNLLNAAAKQKVRRFVFSSSAAVYGEPERVPIAEDAALRPVNPYGGTKRVFEALLEEYERACGLRYAALRYFNVAGAYGGLGEDHRPETHLVPKILAAAAEPGRVFQVFGDDYPTHDGTCVRDYLHVHDLARAHLLALAVTEERSAVYNLGSENGFTVREVFAAVERVTGRRVRVETVGRRAGDPAALLASSAKIRAELGWKPEKTLDDMIGDAWHFVQQYPRGYAE